MSDFKIVRRNSDRREWLRNAGSFDREVIMPSVSNRTPPMKATVPTQSTNGSVASRARRAKRPTPEEMRPSVLLTDGQERSSVAACHALRRAGYRVGAAGSSSPAPAHWSRACEERFKVSDPLAGDARFAEEIAEIAAERHFDVVMPGTDASVLALSRHRGAFDGGIDPGWPAGEVVEAAMQKADLHEKAVRAGLAPPETVYCDTAGDALAGARILGFPVLLKPLSSIFEDDDGLRQRRSFVATDRADLERRLPEFIFPCMLQRREGGPLISFAGVVAEGRLLAAVVSRYRRTWPPDAGSASYSETVTAPEALLEGVRSLLAEMRWQGIFELELIQGGPTSFAAIDFNPRLYGSLALAVRAGVPLPVIWCDWLLKGQDGGLIASPGFHYRWEDAELCNLVRDLRRRRIRAAASILQPRRRTAHALFRWNDPAPLVARALNIIGRLRRSQGQEPTTQPPSR
jgi:predicted ATP-grasp superfamily ATP-dependent carboligase